MSISSVLSVSSFIVVAVVDVDVFTLTFTLWRVPHQYQFFSMMTTKLSSTAVPSSAVAISGSNSSSSLQQHVLTLRKVTHLRRCIFRKFLFFQRNSFKFHLLRFPFYYAFSRFIIFTSFLVISWSYLWHKVGHYVEGELHYKRIPYTGDKSFSPLSSCLCHQYRYFSQNNVNVEHQKQNFFFFFQLRIFSFFMDISKPW